MVQVQDPRRKSGRDQKSDSVVKNNWSVYAFTAVWLIVDTVGVEWQTSVRGVNSNRDGTLCRHCCLQSINITRRNVDETFHVSCCCNVLHLTVAVLSTTVISEHRQFTLNTLIHHQLAAVSGRWSLQSADQCSCLVPRQTAHSQTDHSLLPDLMHWTTYCVILDYHSKHFNIATLT